MEQIGVDFQGWPIYALTLGEILRYCGFKKEDGKLCIDADNEVLKAYPVLLSDDGMGYGVNPEYVTEVDLDIYEKKIKAIEYEVGENKKLDITPIVVEKTVKVFNMFRDVPENKIEDED
jgi:hypothetical protein